MTGCLVGCTFHGGAITKVTKDAGTSRTAAGWQVYIESEAVPAEGKVANTTNVTIDASLTSEAIGGIED